MSIIAKLKAEASVLEAEFEKYFSKQSLHNDIVTLKAAIASYIGNVAKHVEEHEAAVVAKAKIDLVSVEHEAEKEVAVVEAAVKSNVVEKVAEEVKPEVEHVAEAVVVDVEHVAADAEAEVKKL